MRPAESPREMLLRSILPTLATAAGLIASIGASLQYWMETGHFRPFALVLHLGLMGTGLYWHRHPPSHASLAAASVAIYLATLIGTFILESGEFSSFVNLAMVSVGSGIFIADRRCMLVAQAVVAFWFLVGLRSPMHPPDPFQLVLVTAMVGGVAICLYIVRARSISSEAPPLSRELVHDVNNLLGGILGGADLALASEDHPEDLRFALRQIRERALATRDYIREAAVGGLAAESVDANLVAHRAVELARGLGEDRIKVVTDLAPDLPHVVGDRSALERAVLNLIVNAHDAQPEGQGEVRVRTRVAEDSNSASTVVLRVEDDGEGIDPAIRRRIFEPGFTTRSEGHTGLGLAYVARVAAEHEGTVRIDDRIAIGTAIELRLPAGHRTQSHATIPLSSSAPR